MRASNSLGKNEILLKYMLDRRESAERISIKSGHLIAMLKEAFGLEKL